MENCVFHQFKNIFLNKAMSHEKIQLFYNLNPSISPKDTDNLDKNVYMRRYLQQNEGLRSKRRHTGCCFLFDHLIVISLSFFTSSIYEMVRSNNYGFTEIPKSKLCIIFDKFSLQSYACFHILSWFDHGLHSVTNFFVCCLSNIHTHTHCYSCKMSSLQPFYTHVSPVPHPLCSPAPWSEGQGHQYECQSEHGGSTQRTRSRPPGSVCPAP